MNLKILALLTFVFSTTISLSQKKEIIKVYLKDGNTSTIEFKLRDYLGKLIFPDDNKNFIEGKNLRKEKVRINKSDISEIELSDGFKYQVISDSKSTYIGYFIARGKLNIFESYPYGRDITITIPVSQALTPVNKTASLVHYEVTDDGLTPLNTKRKLKELAAECTELSERLNVNKSLKDLEQAKEAFGYYNYFCDESVDTVKNVNCTVVLFRGITGESKEPTLISIEEKTIRLLPISIDTVQVKRINKVSICSSEKSNCYNMNLNPAGINYFEVSKNKKTLETKINFVGQRYGEYYANQIAQAVKSKK